MTRQSQIERCRQIRKYVVQPSTNQGSFVFGLILVSPTSLVLGLTGDTFSAALPCSPSSKNHQHRTRRVVQLGLKGKWLERLGSGDAVVRVERLDDLLIEQRTALTSSEPHLLRVPVARPLDMGHLQV